MGMKDRSRVVLDEATTWCGRPGIPTSVSSVFKRASATSLSDLSHALIQASRSAHDLCAASSP
eukprot:CAMPEP_0174928672 /NCGR_PEP_ID=MMETSP1355-20121228/25207_1 /TAXON_ID=464990 /ORGANISM="Hemiselmis tepida, Strain CCMP443" /LENGTH=62 /DNA_ID=CAMNT_0016174841 /DNA_START=24 /DNA_END=209 /DNA_ORIENTATION=+